MRLLLRFSSDRSGAASIEYALLAGIVSIAAVAALALIGTPLGELFSSVATGVSGAADATGGE